MALEIPEYIEIALRKHPRAAEAFDNLSDIQRKHYVEWVSNEQLEDKREERLQQMLERLGEGKKEPKD